MPHKYIFLLIIFLVLAGCSRNYMKDLSLDPVFNAADAEVVANLSKPPGNIAVSKDGRVFFTFHPDADPEIKVAELVNGAPRPFPGMGFQKKRDNAPFFDTVLSVRIDHENRLWTLDHGSFGMGQPRLLAFDLNSGEVVHQHDFQSDIAGFGSFLNDFQVDPSGRAIYIADTALPAPVIGGSPALIVYDIENRKAKRVLDDHHSVRKTSLTVRVGEEDFAMIGIPIHIAVDSIAQDRNGEWLYYGAVNGEKLYRIKCEHLLNDDLSREILSEKVETYAEKTMSDGLTADVDGNIYITDMEHSAVHLIGKDRKLRTLLKDPRFRWPDGFGFGPQGWLYFTCSSLMDVVGKSASHIEEQAPYQIFRFKPGHEGTPGH